jgi:hypothetical protein
MWKLSKENERRLELREGKKGVRAINKLARKFIREGTFSEDEANNEIEHTLKGFPHKDPFNVKE